MEMLPELARPWLLMMRLMQGVQVGISLTFSEAAGGFLHALHCFLHVKNVNFLCAARGHFLLYLHCKICLTPAPAGPYSKLHGWGPILASTSSEKNGTSVLLLYLLMLVFTVEFG
jgi:hypothetical protein